MAANPGVRVVVADDDLLLREGVATILGRAGMTVVGTASEPEALLALVREHAPDLVVIDIRMPPTHTTEGIDAAATISRFAPDAGILLLSAFVDLAHAVKLFGSGGRIGYLLKSRVVDAEEFVTAARRVLAGEVVIDREVVDALIGRVQRGDPLAELTPRELEVLSLMAEGCSNLGIGHRLAISESAVEKHIRSILTKLELSSTPEDHRRVLAVLTYLESR